MAVTTTKAQSTPDPKSDARKRREDRGKRKRVGAQAVTCTLRVPTAPLTAAGLATPYRLAGNGCNEANGDTAAFVEATIVDPAAGTLAVYRPLVIDDLFDFLNSRLTASQQLLKCGSPT